ncbi:hypothetical protein LTR53_013171 [Teratosphaeriaceae sp. CCFEE 6253]|nr:hypothetical protein LTR53_013171 [Teratosphaeriaceae sp. CCFEE 6253]
MVAAHQVDGIELEEYYDQGLCSWDAVGVMLEGNEDLSAKQLLAQMESETLCRTPLARHSPVRPALVDAYVLAHPSYVSAVSSGIHSAVYATRKRLRYSASLALLEHERALQREDLDVDEVQSRREALQKPSSLCELIQQHMASRDSGLSPANVEALHEDEDIDDLFCNKKTACPYGCGARFTTVKALIIHLEEPMDPENDSKEHDDLKAKDGWYSARFFGVIAPKKGKKQKAMIDEEGTDSEVVYDITIKEFEGRASGRWAGLPEVSGLVEFDAAAAADTTGSLTYFGVNG